MMSLAFTQKNLKLRGLLLSLGLSLLLQNANAACENEGGFNKTPAKQFGAPGRLSGLGYNHICMIKATLGTKDLEIVDLGTQGVPTARYQNVFHVNEGEYHYTGVGGKFAVRTEHIDARFTIDDKAALNELFGILEVANNYQVGMMGERKKQHSKFQVGQTIEMAVTDAGQLKCWVPVEVLEAYPGSTGYCSAMAHHSKHECVEADDCQWVNYEVKTLPCKPAMHKIHKKALISVFGEKPKPYTFQCAGDELREYIPCEQCNGKGTTKGGFLGMSNNKCSKCSKRRRLTNTRVLERLLNEISRRN